MLNIRTVRSSRKLASLAGLVLLSMVVLTTSCSLIKTSDYYIASAKRYSNKGQLREAAIQLLNAIKLNPHNARAHLELGRVANRLNDPHTALAELSQAAQLDPDNMDIKVEYGNALVATNKFDDAERQA